jgi:diketogulonate reductase-like aldo/keto reductase
MMVAMRTITLNNGVTMPQLGFGVFQVSTEDTYGTVAEALRVGYRSIDTAAAYRNEEPVGRAIAESGVPRDEVFVTTKLWNSAQGYDEAFRAFDESMDRLGLDRLDLYLIHWPAPKQDRYVDTWRALGKLYADGRVRAIGESSPRTWTGWSRPPARCPRSTRSSCTRGSSRRTCAPTTPGTAS